MRDATWHARQPAAVGIPAHRGAEWLPRSQWMAPVPLEDAMAAATARSEVIYAYANHGRWVVECPDCRGAQLACRTDHRFMCNECANFAIGSQWRTVTWPADAAAIEEELDRRPRAQNRNWFPGETVASLRLEFAANRARG